MVKAQPDLQPSDFPQWQWSIDDYHRMIAAGILTKCDRNLSLEK
ncbi:MAG: hypothetical protein ACTS2F_27970 [Thainema sp.]